MLHLHLRDINGALVEAWRRQFRGVPRVTVSEGDIFDAGPHDAIVSPANSFGFMDGGIDLAYSRHFGWDLQERLQARLATDFGGELPVGQAVAVETGDADLPWLISAPTMRVPHVVADTVNAYLALRAALRVAREEGLETVLCPGLGTAVGRMPPSRCAYQMHVAWLAVHGELPAAVMLGQARELHISMLTA